MIIPPIIRDKAIVKLLNKYFLIDSCEIKPIIEAGIKAIIILFTNLKVIELI